MHVIKVPCFRHQSSLFSSEKCPFFWLSLLLSLPPSLSLSLSLSFPLSLSLSLSLSRFPPFLLSFILSFLPSLVRLSFNHLFLIFLSLTTFLLLFKFFVSRLFYLFFPSFLSPFLSIFIMSPSSHTLLSSPPAVLFAFFTVLTLLTMIEEKKRFINKLEIKIEKVVNF